MGMVRDMTTLYIWGSDARVSAIFPECQAAVWLADGATDVVAANNTNLLSVGELPVMISDTNRYQGYVAIATQLGLKFTLEQRALVHLLLDKMLAVANYVYFINSRNYEGYTRKQFARYFPFPMMYNQPLQFYGWAQHQAQYAGLSTNKGGFFSFDVVGPTEYVNDDNDDEIVEEDEKQLPAMSRLHERQLVKKSQTKAALKEANNAARCLHLLDEILTPLKDAAELKVVFPLLVTYIQSLTNPDLPDQFAATYLNNKYADLVSQAQTLAKLWEGELRLIRGPEGLERPSLTNEIRYALGQYV